MTRLLLLLLGFAEALLLQFCLAVHLVTVALKIAVDGELLSAVLALVKPRPRVLALVLDQRAAVCVGIRALNASLGVDKVALVFLKQSSTTTKKSRSHACGTGSNDQVAEQETTNSSRTHPFAGVSGGALVCGSIGGGRKRFVAPRDLALVRTIAAVLSTMSSEGGLSVE